jgi:hypothetical protein
VGARRVTTASRAPHLARLYDVEIAYDGMDSRRNTAERRSARPHAAARSGAELGQLAARGMRCAHAAPSSTHCRSSRCTSPGAARCPRCRCGCATRDAERAVVELRLEDGVVVTQQCDALPVPRRARGGWTPTHTIRLDRRLPIGYHEAQVETAGGTFGRSSLPHLAVPTAVPGSPGLGRVLPLYALGSATSWGVGDYTDLGRAARWIGGLGGGFISTLPLLATFLDAPFEPSPYSPASRLFWNELFIDVTAVPGWAGGDAALAAELAQLRAGRLIDYRQTAALKRRELEHARRGVAGDAAVRQALDRFSAAHPRATDYARFRAVCDRRREGWPVWPDRMRDGTIQDGDFAPEDYDYHLFAQWQADAQLGTVAAARQWRRCTLPGHAAGRAPRQLRRPGGFVTSSPTASPPARRRTRCSPAARTGGSAADSPGVAPVGLPVPDRRVPPPPATRGHAASRPRHVAVPAVLGATRASTRSAASTCGTRRTSCSPSSSWRRHATVPSSSARTWAPCLPQYAAQWTGTGATHARRPVRGERRTATRPRRRPRSQRRRQPEHARHADVRGFWRGSEIDDQLDLGPHRRDEHRTAHAAAGRAAGSCPAASAPAARSTPASCASACSSGWRLHPPRFVLVTLEDLWLEPEPQNVPGTSHESGPTGSGAPAATSTR